MEHYHTTRTSSKKRSSSKSRLSSKTSPREIVSLMIASDPRGRGQHAISTSARRNNSPDAESSSPEPETRFFGSINIAFRGYTANGRLEMDEVAFASLCSNCGFLDEMLTLADIGFIFDKVALQGIKRYVGLHEFQKALVMIAEKVGMDASFLIEQIARSPTPCYRLRTGQEPTAVHAEMLSRSRRVSDDDAVSNHDHSELQESSQFITEQVMGRLLRASLGETSPMLSEQDHMPTPRGVAKSCQEALVELNRRTFMQEEHIPSSTWTASGCTKQKDATTPQGTTAATPSAAPSAEPGLLVAKKVLLQPLVKGQVSTSPQPSRPGSAAGYRRPGSAEAAGRQRRRASAVAATLLATPRNGAVMPPPAAGLTLAQALAPVQVSPLC
eukprot:gnl/TRDRNA2_/TRDRNA2_175297_c0_seq1.p1 gnl/TRDRNA2_/TRDRNA2_175297_c0~~gnl/TRDRNA2_/TRDRNA2_175297_c0_seq1.p1  ORF type:complete len:411 (-),score=44.81 gnl/TRDRNA2_/TRDRNA2_175297_c0_seq1:656-1810(-)